MQHIVDLF